MNYKKIKKFSLITLSSILLFSCSSYHQLTQAERDSMQKLGAQFKNRSYIAEDDNLVPVRRIGVNQIVSNPGDVLQQINYVKSDSASLSKRYNNTYQKVIDWLISGGDTDDLEKFGLKANIMRGMDGYNNVLFTGYYSPVLHARKKPVGSFKHPIYALPKDKRYTRKQIYEGALKGKGLELVYSNSQLDNFLLGVQGSGYVDLGNGQLNYLAYAGQNGFKYKAIGRLLVEKGEIPKEKMSIQAIKAWAKKHPTELQSLLEENPSYVFFKNDPSGKVKGSAGIPLVPLASVASDRAVIPSGSTLLVEVPQIDKEGHFTGKYSYRLMIALDVGGAINGQHLDLYQGIGDKAGHTAGLMKHYGRVWVLK